MSNPVPYQSKQKRERLPEIIPEPQMRPFAGRFHPSSNPVEGGNIKPLPGAHNTANWPKLFGIHPVGHVNPSTVAGAKFDKDHDVWCYDINSTKPEPIPWSRGFRVTPGSKKSIGSQYSGKVQFVE